MATATPLDYSSLQSIREDAGLQNLMKTESPSGSVDGVNKVFTVGRTYIVDRNYNDVIDVGSVNGDVIVYDDATPVQVDAVDSVTGTITLNVAPVVGSKMLVNYAFSVLSDIAIAERRLEAIDFVHGRISGIINFDNWQDSNTPDVEHVPYRVRTATRLYAAGLLLINDQGLNIDVEKTSKDGYHKIGTAKNIIDAYLADVSNTDESSSRVAVVSYSDGNIFKRNKDLSTYNASKPNTDAFFHNEC